MANCETCAVVNKFVSIIRDYIQELSPALLPGMLDIFYAGIGIWGLLECMRMAWGQFNAYNTGLTLFFAIIAAGLLQGQGNTLILTLFNLSLEVMAGASSVALVGDADIGDIGPILQENGGLTVLVASSEKAIIKVIQIADLVFQEGGLTDPLPWIYGLALVVPYFAMMVVFAAQLVVAVFRLMMIAAFTPYLYLVMTFGFGRKLLPKALDTMLASIFTIFAVTVVLGMVMSGIEDFISDVQASSSSSEAISITNPHLVIMIALGWISVALMTEATSIANSIAQTNLTNTAVGVMAGAAGANAAAIGKAAMTAGGGGLDLATSQKARESLKEAIKDRWSTIRSGGQGIGNMAKGGAAIATGGATKVAEAAANRMGVNTSALP